MKILTLALLSWLTFFLLFSRKQLSTNQMLFRICLQFAIVLILVLVGGSIFGWVELLKWHQLIIFLGSIIAVYAVVIFTTLISLKKSTDQLNEQLNLWKNKK